MKKNKVAILLATYNGEKYLSAQLDSILNQTYKNFDLYISDDGSTDDTLEILHKYELENSNIKILERNNYDLHGAKENFLYLLKSVDSEIYLFADQDDVWDECHVEKLVSCYEHLQEGIKQKPILIHSDLRIVNDQLKEICSSIFKYNNMDKNNTKDFRYFVQNNVTGCSMLVNYALKNYVFKDEYALLNNIKLLPMHDNFFACIASIFGKIIFLDEVTVNYRQHNHNVVGAKNSKLLSYNFKKVLVIREQRNIIKNQEKFVAFFIKYYETEINKKVFKILNIFSNLDKHIKPFRVFFLFRHGFLRYGAKRILLQIIFI